MYNERSVDINKLQPGDFVFFKNEENNRLLAKIISIENVLSHRKDIKRNNSKIVIELGKDKILECSPEQLFTAE